MVLSDKMTTPTTNGHENLANSGNDFLSAKLSHFICDTSYESLSPPVIEKLKELLLDHLGVASAAAQDGDSSGPFLNGIVAFGGAASGTSTVYTKGHAFAPQYAALLNGTFAHTFDFDDTYAGGALHPGASVIPAALVQSESSQVDGKTLLTALAVGYEVICRLSRALGCSSYDRGFHNTGTAGIFGAIAAIGKAKSLPSTVIASALGLAGSKAAGSMQFMEDGSWNKRLHPGFAAHDALLCVSLAEAGVKGTRKVFEGKAGVLHSYSEKATLEGFTDDLGKTWVFMETALKPYPACRVTHASIDLATKLSKVKSIPVDTITVALTRPGYNLVGLPTANKIRPNNVVDAQFSNQVQTAIAWIHGSELGWGAYDKIYDADVQDLSARVKMVIDDSLPSGLATRFKVRWQDGTEAEDELMAPVGEPSNPFAFEKLKLKYLSLTRSVYGETNAVRILDIVKDLEQHRTLDLMALL